MSRSYAGLVFAWLSLAAAVASAEEPPAAAPPAMPPAPPATPPAPPVTSPPAMPPPATPPAPPVTSPAPPVTSPAPPEAPAPDGQAAGTPAAPSEQTAMPAAPGAAAPAVVAPPRAAAAPPSAPAPTPTPSVAPAPPSARPAFDVDVAPEIDWSSTPLGAHQQNWFALLGARIGFETHPGFDPYADDDLLAQLSVGLGGVVYTSGRLSVAALGLWDFAGRSSAVRGEETGLLVHRFQLGPELRYHLLHRLYAFARVTPGAALALASLENQVAGSTRLEAHGWLFSADAVAGAAVEAFGNPDGEVRSLRTWVAAEGGYGWSSSADLAFSAPEHSDAPERGMPLSLGDFALRGPLVRVSLLVTAL